MTSSRIEINFCRLLHRCEEMSANKRNGDWRLETYIGALESQFSELKRQSRVSSDVLSEYRKRLDFIKGLVEAEKLPTSSHKVLATELLSPVSHGSFSQSAKEVHLKVKAKHQTDAREELLGRSHDDDNSLSGLRRRQTETSDIDTVLKHHHRIQERLADEMVLMAQNLKNNATMAGDIVRRDTHEIDSSTKMADGNFEKLKVETGRLQGYTKTCNWWIWVFLVAVIATFLWMIVFMKMFKKKVS